MRTPVAVVVTIAAAGLALPGAANARCSNTNLKLNARNGVKVSTAILCLVNEQRTAAGVPKLKRNRALTRAAAAHSRDMLAHRYFDHDSRNGTSYADRIRKAGYAWTAAAENIGKSFTTARKVLAGWKRSAPHRKNMLSRSYADAGVGAAGGRGGTRFTMDFGHR